MYKLINEDEFFMEMAKDLSQRSTCLRRHVGAVLVKDKRVISMGYNGSPKKLEHCADLGCVRENSPQGVGYDNCRSVHAEANALIHAALVNLSCEQGTIYVTAMPCYMCAKMIINAELSRVVVQFETVEPYFDQTIDLLHRAGIVLDRL